MKKTMDELRKEFEDMAYSCFFDISRNEDNEYKGFTFYLWGGYWKCALTHGIIDEETAMSQFKKINT